MSQWLMENKEIVRPLIFIGVFVVMALLEWVIAYRALLQSRWRRWTSNLGMLAISSGLIMLLGPLTTTATAYYAQQHHWGLFNLLQWNAVLEFLLALVILDFAIYVQHVASHRFAWLWRLHRVHHIDRDIDVTTGIRFHPVEIMLSLAYKFIVILLLGPSLLAVVAYEILLNAMAMFNHANIRLPAWLDRWLRLLIVTPDMHRVHHSVIPLETNSNYANFLSLWDRLFKTYRAQPRDGHLQMQLGLKEFQRPEQQTLLQLLLNPFVSHKTTSSDSAAKQ